MKKNITFLVAICLLLNIFIPVFKSTVFAVEEKNEVTLNFLDATIENGKAVYRDGSNVEGTVGLVTKNSDSGGYDSCPIEKNSVTDIDLNKNEYYLEVNPKILVNNPDEILESTDYTPFNRLYINKKSYDITSNSYVYLDPAEFSVILDIKLEKVSSNPSGPSYPDDISIIGTYDGCGMEIYLNGEKVGGKSKAILGSAKGYASGENSNLIRIQLAFGDGNIGSVTVNRKAINIPEGTKDRLEFVIKPASKYIIDVKKSKDDTGLPRTIIWDSDKSNNSSLKDNEFIKNGTIEILDIKDIDGNSIGLEGVSQDISKNSGYAIVKPGYKVILRLKPDYGYQLTSIKINDQNLVAQKEQSVFEYIMPNTNVHLSGIFEKVDDIVKSELKDIKEGTIELGDSEIDSGSAVLSVSDSNLSEDQILNFQKAANGYKISSHFGIRLNQVLYKGTSDDVWSNELNDLNNDAVISLKLENGINGNEVVMVHEKHDGSYEIIPTSYDASSNTLTFKTSSFSNYAIAVKEGSSDMIPQTGDDIVVYVILVTLAVALLIALLIFSRKKKVRNQ